MRRSRRGKENKGIIKDGKTWKPTNRGLDGIKQVTQIKLNNGHVHRTHVKKKKKEKVKPHIKKKEI